MVLDSGKMTAKELAASSNDGRRRELVKGQLRMMSPAGKEHGRVTVRLTWRLAQYVEQQELGVVLAAETGFRIESNPDTVRAPDVAFVTSNRWSNQPDQGDPYWPGAPDLAVEVVSPGDSFSEVEEKALAWLAAGTRVVWVIDPRQRNVTIYHGKEDIVVLTAEAKLAEPELFPGWEVRVSELFG